LIDQAIGHRRIVRQLLAKPAIAWRDLIEMPAQQNPRGDSRFHP
jgi:hypothetical protein